MGFIAKIIMKQRDLFFDQEAREKLKRGIDSLANMVKITLGPKGNNVIIEKTTGYSLITKDGVTVAKEIFLKDSVENIGAQLLKEVALKTNETAGDGTTTATVLAQAIISEGIKSIVAGVNPIDLKRGIDLAVNKVCDELKNLRVKVESKDDIINIASISANNDYEIGNIIADAMDRAGNDGTVIVEDAKGVNTVVDVVEGMQFDRGYKHVIFINKKTTMEVELQNPYIIIYNNVLSQVPALASLMEQIIKKGNSSLLVIADDFSDEVMRLLVLNSAKGIIRCCAVMSPGYGDRRFDLLNDISVFTGGTILGNEDFPITKATLNDLGKADKVIINNNKTIIVGGKGNSEKIKETIDQIRHLIYTTTVEYDRQKLQERLGKLTGGIVVLRVGSVTDTELTEKKMRIEDALHAVRAALEEGIVPGGGVALIRARKVLKNRDLFSYVKGNIVDQNIGVDIVYRALEVPLLSICNNSGLVGQVILKEIENNDSVEFGYDVLGDKFGNLYELGVIDPTKVVRLALENAASVAGLFLMTKGVICMSETEKNYVDGLMLQGPKY